MMVAMQATSLRFAEVARLLGQATRARGLEVPAFRSPPRVAGASRTLRRGRNGATTVAVQLHDRPFVAVVADMVEGVVAANRLDGIDATRVRTALWEAVTDAQRLAA